MKKKNVILLIAGGIPFLLVTALLLFAFVFGKCNTGKNASGHSFYFMGFMGSAAVWFLCLVDAAILLIVITLFAVMNRKRLFIVISLVIDALGAAGSGLLIYYMVLTSAFSPCAFTALKTLSLQNSYSQQIYIAECSHEAKLYEKENLFDYKFLASYFGSTPILGHEQEVITEYQNGIVFSLEDADSDPYFIYLKYENGQFSGTSSDYVYIPF